MPAVTGRLGENLSVEQGREAVPMNALAVAQQHLGNLDRLIKLVKLSVFRPRQSTLSSTRPSLTAHQNCFFNFRCRKTVICGWYTVFKVCQSARLSW
jgi:hypothetical protein